MATNLICVSDTHINSRVALCPPVFNLGEGGTYRSSRPQRALWDAWIDFWQTAGKLPGEKIAVINGDLGELDVKRRTFLITPNKAAIIQMVLQALEPMLDNVDKLLVIRGTMAHEGKDSWLEEAIANDLDNTITHDHTSSWYHFRGSFSGVRFDIAHHATAGRLPWTEKDAAGKVAKVIMARYSEMGSDPPHVAIRSHNHSRSDSGRNYPVRAVLTPCWSMWTEYAYRIGMENKVPDIGGDVFICDNGKYEWIDYRYQLAPIGRRLWSIKF